MSDVAIGIPSGTDRQAASAVTRGDLRPW
jgi:hypothetical protein